MVKESVWCYINQNKLLFLILLAYAVVLVSVLDFGIPNLNHPFTYHMDEWHQLMAVRALFKHGSSNVVGAANGPIFFFLQSGIFLGPFYLLKIVDPFVIKSSVASLMEQQRLFEILRLNTLVYGIGSIILVWEIAKRYLRISPLLPTLFFTMTPVWIMLSNYFKYDIALMFFLLLSLLALLFFAKNPTRYRFFLSALPIGCALSIKISALPLILSYILAYYLFAPKSKKKVVDLLGGVGIIFLTFFVVGIPDSLFHAHVYYEFFYNNIISGPSETSNYMLGTSLWIFMLLHIYPLLFGYGFYVLFVVSLGFISYSVFSQKKMKEKNIEVFLIITFFLFVLSLIPLKIQATGNRVLILLPFMALFIGIFREWLIKTKSSFLKFIFIVCIFIAIVGQAIQVYAWLQMKYGKNPREEASVWMKENLPSQVIGLENIPIYQQIPDFALYEFYLLQENPKTKTYFTYEVLDENTKKLPPTIIITNVEYEKYTLKHSSKKALLTRMEKDGYKETKRFNPSGSIYVYFADFKDIPLTGLLPLIPISIYQK